VIKFTAKKVLYNRLHEPIL